MSDEILSLQNPAIDQLIEEMGVQGIVMLMASSLMRNPELQFSLEEAKAMIRSCADSL